VSAEALWRDLLLDISGTIVDICFYPDVTLQPQSDTLSLSSIASQHARSPAGKSSCIRSAVI